MNTVLDRDGTCIATNKILPSDLFIPGCPKKRPELCITITAHILYGAMTSLKFISK